MAKPEPGRALVVANGEMPSAALVRELAAQAELVVGADGGGAKALASGVEPNIVVGDLDSFGEGEGGLPGERVVHIEDAETTDLQKAVEYCLARKMRRVDIVGAGGGRADHALGNLSVLLAYRGRADLRIVDDLFEIRLVDGVAVVERPEGTVVSLMAIGECRGVTTEGLRWELRDETLGFSPRGIHNEVAKRPARVSVASGDLLLFEGRWVERHR